MRCHRPAVGVGERDLALPALVQLRQQVFVPFTPLPNRGDLLGQVFDARAIFPALGAVALVEALKIVLELGIGGFDELGQRRPREIAFLVVNALIRVPSTASNSRPNKSSWRQSSTNSRNTWRKAVRLSRRKSAIVLKSGFK